MAENNESRVPVDDIEAFASDDIDEAKCGLIFVSSQGKNVDGQNIYQFLFATDSSETWVEGWEDTPAGNMPNITPEYGQYEYIKELRTDLTFDLAQDNTCHSFQDAQDGILALAWENLAGYEQYPTPIRLVFHYGMTIQEVEDLLRRRDLRMKYV